MQHSGTLAAFAEDLHSGPHTHTAVDNSSSSPGLRGHRAHMMHTHEGICTYTENKNKQNFKDIYKENTGQGVCDLGLGVSSYVP